LRDWANDEFLSIENCVDSKGKFDGKLWLQRFHAWLMSGERERYELKMDVGAGDSNAIAAKAACEALDKLPFKYEGPGTTESPERQKAIETHDATWNVWRKERSPTDPAALEAFIKAEQARASKELWEWNSRIQDRLNWYMANPGWYGDPETGQAMTRDGRKGPSWLDRQS
jgi:hypothetical protein